MEEDYNSIIEDFRARGKSDQYIANFLVYNPKYKLDINTANALLNIDSKKKEEEGPFTLSSSISSDIVLASPSELTERTQNPISKALSPSIKEEELDPQIKQWRNYNISEGLHGDVNMYDNEDMQSAYVTDAVDWSLENNVFEESLSREDLLGGDNQSEMTDDQASNIRSAMSAYDEFLKERGERSVTDDQISERERCKNTIYNKNIQQAYGE